MDLITLFFFLLPILLILKKTPQRDEPPEGSWTLIVIDNVNPSSIGKFHEWSIKLWGEQNTSIIPTPSVTSTYESTIPTSTPMPSKPKSTDLPIGSNDSNFSLSEAIGPLLGFITITVVGFTAFLTRRYWAPSWLLKLNQGGYRFKTLENDLASTFGDDDYEIDDISHPREPSF